MLTYNSLKTVIATEYSKYSNRYNTNIKIGRSNPIVGKYILAGQLHKMLSSFNGNEDLDSVSKEDIQTLIRLFNRITNSTIQIDYET